MTPSTRFLPCPRGRTRGDARTRPSRALKGQRGAAVLMALFVATLATLIVTGLFYRQFVLLRTIENQQLVSQSRQLLRGALDWGRAILREDGRRSNYDALSEPWAQPLAETRLDQLGETGSIAALASIAGSMEDAQSRLNLRNLIVDGHVVEKELESLRRLATLLQLPGQTADLIGERMLQALTPPTLEEEDEADSEAAAARPLPLMLPADISGVQGISPEAADRLGPYIVILDERTPVNANTATPEVIAARIPGLSLAEARALVAERERISYFRDIADVRLRLGNKGSAVTDAELSTTSRFFFVRGEVKLDRAVTRMEALVKRGGIGQSTAPVNVLWTREI